MPWFPYFPDLTHLNFFMWGYVKDCVYVTEPHSLKDVRKKIRIVIESIIHEMLQNTWQKLAYRLDVCLDTHGTHIVLPNPQ